jgi:hypothetical protein
MPKSFGSYNDARRLMTGETGASNQEVLVKVAPGQRIEGSVTVESTTAR